MRRRPILSEDQAQLRQIETKLAELMALPTAEQARRQCLIDALQRGKTELSRPFGRLQRQRLLVA